MVDQVPATIKFHVGVEMGGTSCKVGVFTHDSSDYSGDVLRRVAYESFMTSETTPETTLTEMSEWLSSKV